MKRIRKLDPDQFRRWREQAELIEKDNYGEKVLRLADGSYLKMFRRKHWLSKTLFYPPAERFADNAAALARLGIPCPKVKAVYRLDNPYRSVVHYDPLPGTTLRQLLERITPAQEVTLFIQLAEFIIRLHDLGIYFRSLHMGNIVLTPDDSLGLIDISDLRCLGKPLSLRLRRRNYRHLLRYDADWARVPQDVRWRFQAVGLQVIGRGPFQKFPDASKL